jgi:hypothetical protein
MLDPHIGDLAELYVLGDLDASDVATLEEHIAVCEACLRRVGEAEETVLALERGERAEIGPGMFERRLLLPVQPSPRSFVRVAVTAACAGLVLGILATFLSLTLRPNDTQRALVAMVGSHFNHAQFAPVGSQNAPAAKVIYARDKSWLFIIANGSERYGVYAVSPAGATLLGNLQPQGTSSTLYVDHPVAPTHIELRNGTTVLARAALR